MENINNQFEKRDAFRRNIFNDVKSQNGLMQSLKQYNDNATLDENVLKEMAGAYANVLSKYGYSVQQNKAEQQNKTEHLVQRSNSGISSSTENQGIISDNSTTNQSNKEKQNNIQTKEENGVLKGLAQTNTSGNAPFNNFDYLQNNYLTEQGYVNNQLQLTNNLLTQILNELRVISCLVERNRRHRLS